LKTMNQDMKRKTKIILPTFLMGGLFIVIHSLALLVTRPFEAADMVAFENPNDPMNIVYFFLTLLVFTAIILLIAKFWKKRLVQGIFLGATGFTAFYVFYPLLYIVIPGVLSFFLSITAAAILIITLVKYPEWFVIDICGVIIGVGAIGMLGISLSIFLAIVLLIVLATYDAISVYKTKHMIDLADIVLDLKLPVILVVPKVRDYSLLKETKSLKEKLKGEEERDAFLVGLGDIIIPGVLVASTFHNIASNGLLMALSVMLGTLLGFTVLMTVLIKGKPQAGLPYLCSGAILGYLVSSYVLFGELVGLTFPV
jgi:presenilin-like A22 family membrane protease